MDSLQKQTNLRNTDKVVYKVAAIYQKSLRKLVKAKLDREFLNSCKDNSVYPKFVRWKNAKYKSLRERNKLYLKNLKDTIKTRNNDIRKLGKDHEQAKETLCFHICLEGKKNETVGLFLTFLAQEITRDK